MHFMWILSDLFYLELKHYHYQFFVEYASIVTSGNFAMFIPLANAVLKSREDTALHLFTF